MWDQVFSKPGYAYGTAANDFLRERAHHLPAGPVLSLGEGEGRNAAHLASLGHPVTAVDSSAVGLRKARALVAERGLDVETEHADLSDYDLGTARWSGIVEVFCHLPAPLRDQVHRRVAAALRPGGVFLLEAYAPEQLEHGTGGPPLLERLYALDDVVASLEGLELVESRSVVRDIQEGEYHHGPGAVIQIIARRP